MNAKEAPPEAVREKGAEEEAQQVEAPAAGASEDDQGIGVRVTAVFTAAEKAGQHIVSLAREEAEDILRQAKAEAEAYRREQKLDADKEVEQIFADARAKADVIEAQARTRAQEVEDDARVRKERLREEARLIEERIAWVVEGLSEVTERIDQVFVATDSIVGRSEKES